jgi:hypothetical protein
VLYGNSLNYDSIKSTEDASITYLKEEAFNEDFSSTIDVP